jgi:holo-ACP synthase/triphosphoribosyl-dephospho-CoA synthase
LFQKNKRPSADAILSACASMGKLISQYDFPASREKKDPSHGEKQFLNYGMSGARGEAASGFSSIRRFGLPSLKKALAMGFSMNDAGVYALLNLIANVTIPMRFFVPIFWFRRP